MTAIENKVLLPQVVIRSQLACRIALWKFVVEGFTKSGRRTPIISEREQCAGAFG
jgi:hypothetical protein